MAANVTKTAIRLADGRELFYFDEKQGVDRSQPDRRDIDTIRTASEIRYDVLVDQWVVIASHRQTRTHLPAADQCPLCPSTPGRPTEIPADDYDVVVFENRFPSLSHGVESGAVGPAARERGDGLFLRRPGIGRFEVHIYPRRHVPDLTALDGAEREEFPELYLDMLHRFDGIFGTKMPYIAGWQQAPVLVGHELAHLFLQVFSIRRAPNKLKYLAGSESAVGVFINDVAPEQAAQMLRDVR